MILPAATGEELLAGLEARAALVSTIRGVADTGIETAQGTFSGDQIVVAERPAAFRLEALGLFGGPLFLLAYDGTRLTAFALESHTYWRGPYPPRDASFGFPFPDVAADRLVDLVCAVPRLLPAGERIVATTRTGDTIQLHLASKVSGASQDLVLDAASGVLVGLTEKGEMGEPLLEIEYGRYEEEVSRGPGEERILFPRQMNFAFSSTATHLTLRFKDLTLNAPLDPSIFRLPVPRGAKMVDLAG